MDNELKPCPFCGQMPSWVTLPQGFGPLCKPSNFVLHPFAVPVLASCRLAGGRFTLAEWNTRPGEDALRARIAELETACNGQRRAEYDADEMRRALQHVRAVLSRGRTVGHDHQQAALDAENFIIGLSESDDEELDAICSKCGQRMEHVRPGKWQCDCQARTVTHD